MKPIWLWLFFLTILHSPQASAHECLQLTTSGPGVVNYNPSDDRANVQSFRLNIRAVCEFDNESYQEPIEIWFESNENPPDYSFIGQVPFDIRHRGRSVLKTPEKAVLQPLVTSAAPQADTIELDFILSPGYRGRDDVRTISLKWRPAGTSQPPAAMETPVTIGVLPSQVARIALSDSSGIGRMDFGRLSAGQARTLDFQTLASSNFRLTLNSDYGGVLRRAEPCGAVMPPPTDAADSISYTVYLDGRQISDGQNILISQQASGRRMTRQQHALEVRIDDGFSPATTRAGRYCDVLKLTVEPLS
jgi:hypothetical protein